MKVGIIDKLVVAILGVGIMAETQYSCCIFFQYDWYGAASTVYM